MDQEFLRVFFYDVRCAVVMHFSAWSAVYYDGTIETITADMLQTMLIKRSNLMQQCADIYLLQSHSTFFGCHSTHHQEH